MFSLGGFPGVVPGGDTVIEGEVYEVDAAILVMLDQFEGHPRFYRRTLLQLDGGDRRPTCWRPAGRGLPHRGLG